MLLQDHFEIAGVVNFGISGNTNSSLQIGDVIVPKRFVHTGLWDWLNPDDNIASSDYAVLEIANYNEPDEDETINKLGIIALSLEEFYSQSQDNDGNGVKRLWFPVNDYYLELASKLEGTVLENYVGQYRASCLSKTPKIVTGLKGSTSNAFINNAAYRQFLYGTFGVSSADMESSAVVMTCLSNGKDQVVVINGVFTFAGEGNSSDDKFKPLVIKNVATVVVDFVKELYTSLYNMLSLN